MEKKCFFGPRPQALIEQVLLLEQKQAVILLLLSYALGCNRQCPGTRALKFLPHADHQLLCEDLIWLMFKISSILYPSQ